MRLKVRGPMSLLFLPGSPNVDLAVFRSYIHSLSPRHQDKIIPPSPPKNSTRHDLSLEENEDTQTSLRLDLERTMNWGDIKFGGKARWREKKTDEQVELFSNDDPWSLSDAV